jgi:hypothetical protein
MRNFQRRQLKVEMLAPPILKDQRALAGLALSALGAAVDLATLHNGCAVDFRPTAIAKKDAVDVGHEPPPDLAWPESLLPPGRSARALPSSSTFIIQQVLAGQAH